MRTRSSACPRGARRARSSGPSRTRTATRFPSSRRRRRRARVSARRRSTGNPGLEEVDAEHLAPGEAVAGQCRVAVDAAARVGAAVPQLAHVAFAAAKPGAVQVALEAVDLARAAADHGARGWRTLTADRHLAQPASAV